MSDLKPQRNIFGSLIFTPGRRCPELDAAVTKNVKDALAEDLRGEDLSTAMIGDKSLRKAKLVAREDGILAGMFWAEAVFHCLDRQAEIKWTVKDGEAFRAGACLCSVQGDGKALLSGERSALNFLHTLSAAATVTGQYIKRVANSKASIADTRKTIPGLRIAQKYAVVCGGGTNQRLGLYDGILIKDNHIRAAGSLSKAAAAIRKLHPGKNIEAETETLDQVEEALSCKVEIIMLDNFPKSEIKKAVKLVAGKAAVEASGNITLENAAAIAACGVDYISVGALTKHVRAPDISMSLL